MSMRDYDKDRKEESNRMVREYRELGDIYPETEWDIELIVSFIAGSMVGFLLGLAFIVFIP